MTIVLLGGDPKRFLPLAEAYREADKKAGYDSRKLQIAITGYAYISKTIQQAKDDYLQRLLCL